MSAFSQGSLINQIQTIVANGGTTVLSNISLSWIKIVGNTFHALKFASLSGTPATEFKVGREYVIINNTFYDVTIKLSDDSILTVIPPSTERILRILDNTSANGSWEIENSTNLSSPMCLTQEYPVPSSKLYIRPSSVEKPDGTLAAVGPMGYAFGMFPQTSIDFLTGAVDGGVVLTNGHSFALPSTIAVGNFTRMVFSYISASNSVDTAFSAGVSSYASLPSPAELFLTADGLPLSHIDLQCVGLGQYKTAFSATNVIENKAGTNSLITNYVGSGSGVNHYPKNYIKNSEFEAGTTNWAAYGSVSIATTAAVGQLLGKNRSLRIDKNTTAPSGSDYVSAAVFEITPSDLIEPLWLSFDYRQLSPDANYGDFSAKIYDLVNLNYVEIQDSNIPSWQGNYRKMWMPTSNSAQYELRIIPNIADRSLVVDNFFIGRQERMIGVGAEPFHTVTSGTVGSEQIAIASCNINGSMFKTARKDDLIKIRGSINIGSVTGDIGLYLPQFSRDINKSTGTGISTDNEVVGKITAHVGGNVYQGVAFFAGTSTNIIYFTDSAGVWNASNPTVWADGDYAVIDLEYPLSGADTAVEMAKTRSEFTYNASVSDLDDAVSFLVGIDGGVVPNITTSNKYKMVRFTEPFLSPEKIVIEVQPPNGSFWTDASNHFPHVGNYGMWLEAILGSSTDVNVWFGADGGLSGSNWPSLNLLGWKWRIRRPGYIGIGELMPASKTNAGYVTTGTQSFAGHKTWYDTTGIHKIAEMYDDTSIAFYGPITALSAINSNRGLTPIGGVVPVMSHLAGAYYLPASGIISGEGWMRCDGSVVPSGFGSPIQGLTLPDLTGSKFILGTNGSGSGTVPSDNPLGGDTGGANAFTTPALTVLWNSATASTSFTLPTWSGSGSFDRLDLNTHQASHVHTMGNHTHDNTHDHSMKHVHQFTLWQKATDGFNLRTQVNDSYNYDASELIWSEPLISNVGIYGGGSASAAVIVDQGSTGYSFTISISSPAIITRPSHGLNNGTSLTLSTTGAMPSPLNSDDVYYVANALPNSFEIVTAGGVPVDTYGTQSGVHSYYINRRFFTAGVTGENGTGDTAKTASESIITTGPTGDTGTAASSATFTGTQTVGISHTLSGGSVSFDKSVLNSDQNSHTHTITDSRPSFVAAVYLIRVR